jgi:RNA-binding protein YlmH
VSFDQYLLEMASSEYTLAYIAINEGWNRVAHESILVGTQVIGVNKGGLGNLIAESGSLTAATVDDFMAIILAQQTQKVTPSFVQKYDLRSAQKWVQPLCTFCVTQ